MSKPISAEFPFESKYLDVLGSKMHYVDVGEGDPVLFLHGNPTSSYLWRNIIPYLQNDARCVAPDLIGMGKSDKPDIPYRFDDHYKYLTEFISKLGLKNVTLVIHDWGSGLGFRYANEHRDNVKAIAFMEAMTKPMEWADMPPGYGPLFKMLRAPFFGWMMVSVANMFVNKMLPNLIVRKLTPEEFARYREPYKTIKSRKPVRVWPQEVPLGGKPVSVVTHVKAYQEWLQETQIPKLCFYVNPGGIIKEKEATFIKENFPNTKMIHLGEGHHFIQEDFPHEIGQGLADWYKSI